MNEVKSAASPVGKEDEKAEEVSPSESIISPIDAQSSIFEGGNSINYHESHEDGVSENAHADIPLDALVVVPEEEDSEKMSKIRRSWLCCTWCLTWWIPGFCLRICGRMSRRDIQLAFREKLALNIIIFLMCAALFFFIAILGRLLCPTQNVVSQFELAGRTDLKDPWVSAYGKAYQISAIVSSHENSYGVQGFQFTPLLGTDVSNLFYKIPAFNFYCPGLATPAASWDNIMYRPPPSNTHFPHDAVDPTTGAPKFYLEFMNKYARARIGWDMNYIAQTASQEKKVLVIFDNVYDVSSYFNSQVQFLGPDARNIFSNFYGKDISNQWRKLQSMDPKASAYLGCMNSLFYIGTIDHRNDFRCKFSNYMLLATSIVLFAVIGVKFLAALQFSSTKEPDSHDKFCICQVTVFTEGEESIQKTIDSIAVTTYTDFRKLLFVICDGVVVGAGNDRSTPRIVLDILGVDPSVSPRSYKFQSIGEGEQQLNLAKVFSGIYKIEGHAVPFIVVVKVGKRSEKGKPGNRGKRDSQMILMRFLSRVHFSLGMNPLELEMYRHYQFIIGIPPNLYEFILMMDADTEVSPDSLNHMVSALVHDSKIIGLCGETKLSNEKDSWVTMIQVYDYYISHHLAKAFESLFGTVTCLPGCFSMYRVKSAVQNMPVLISPGIIRDYSECRNNTLHLKNLLSLGEDRFLTTLMLKHFPSMKLCFTQDAQCKTVGPDRWSIFLSQRRRWINSTVHNLLELLFLPDLCGMCCFSMRFVIFMDLFSTVVQPVGLLYVLYLIYSIVFANDLFPIISLILLGVIYGLQVLLFILKRQWEQILWMVLYLLAFPIFSFYLPIYSFWRFDNFSWGSTRVVVGDNGKRYVTADVKKFDPGSIPLKAWSVREEELLEKGEAGRTFFKIDEMADGLGKAKSITSSRAVPSEDLGRKSRGSPIPMRMARQAEDMSSLNGRMSATRIGPRSGPRSALSSADSQTSPSDEELLAEIQRVLAGGDVDLEQVTRRQLRTHLEHIFGCDLRQRRSTINALIDSAVKSRYSTTGSNNDEHP